MKNFSVFFFLFFISCHGAFIFPAMAAHEGKSQHESTAKILKFSLSRLKESMRKTMQKNDRLIFENDVLRKSIHDLQRIKETLVTKKAGLSGEPLLPYSQQGKARFTETADMRKRRERTRTLTTVFEQDITRLKKKIRFLEDGLTGKDFSFRKRELLERKEKSEKDLFRAEKRLKSFKKRNKRPLKTIEVLKRKRNELVDEMEALARRVNGF